MQNHVKKIKEAITVRMIVAFFLSLFVLFLTIICLTDNSNALTKIVGKGVLHESNLEYRHLKTIETKWTGKKYVSKKWYKLKKGDILYYAENKGNYEKINLAIGYGAVSTSFQIPIGKIGNYSTGVGKTAKKAGYYRLVVNKKVTMTVKTFQTRRYNIATRKGEGKWKKGHTVSKRYQVRCVNIDMERKK